MVGESEFQKGELGLPSVTAVMERVKPHLRGWLHAGAAPLVLAAGVVLTCLAPTDHARLAAAVYTACGLLMFAVSAVYNRAVFGPRVQEVLKRVDHSNVYLLIAGTYTPVAELALPHHQGAELLWGVWGATVLGILFRCLWPYAPRLLYTALYIALGWAVAPFIGSVLHHSGVTVFTLVMAGGLLYTLGGVIYALKRPDPWPRWFGFHEIFHALTIAAWTSQYVAISLLMYRLR